MNRDYAGGASFNAPKGQGSKKRAFSAHHILCGCTVAYQLHKFYTHMFSHA